MHKRGQVSIFVIIGLVIVAIIGFLLLLSSDVSFNSLEESRVEDIEDYLENCVREIMETSVGNVGFAGPPLQAETFLKNNIDSKIARCQDEIDQNFRNVDRLSDIFVEVDVQEIDYATIGGIYINPNTGQQLYVYERATARVNYQATVSYQGSKFTLKPILVELILNE